MIRRNIELLDNNKHSRPQASGETIANSLHQYPSVSTQHNTHVTHRSNERSVNHLTTSTQATGFLYTNHNTTRIVLELFETDTHYTMHSDSTTNHISSGRDNRIGNDFTTPGVLGQRPCTETITWFG